MFKITSKDSSSRARTGILKTPHGEIKTPAYIIVGTHAKVRALKPKDLKKTKTQVVIANTYHLWQTLGDKLNDFEGLHKKMDWNGPIITDSGGFQVFSLGFAREHRVGKIANIFPDEEEQEHAANLSPEKNLVHIEKNGVRFKTEKGEEFLGPKESIKIQEQLGADIILAFDECTSPLNNYKYTKEALKRTHAWEKKCLKAKARKDQLLFGIVQGGEYQDLRKESAKYIGGLPFDGLAIGGSLGKSKKDMWQVVNWTIPLLPEEKPRHLLGIGQIKDLFDGVERGIDMFDCVIPTREARHGRLWTARGHFDIIKGKFTNNSSPLDKTCDCETCKTLTKKELRERFKSKDKDAARLATIHNIFFFNNLMEQIRDSIQNNTFDKLKQKFLNLKS
ncbi:tRNA guanosine(34) transglycosylase Tgt [bacterium]|nr:tRNA guanosine(34) transglycosylase Tgt [bacterium]